MEHQTRGAHTFSAVQQRQDVTSIPSLKHVKVQIIFEFVIGKKKSPPWIRCTQLSDLQEPNRHTQPVPSITPHFSNPLQAHYIMRTVKSQQNRSRAVFILNPEHTLCNKGKAHTMNHLSGSVPLKERRRRRKKT